MLSRYYVFVVAMIASLTIAHAEGFRLYGMSQEGQMRGEALVASGNGPDANWYNPASLTGMDGNVRATAGLNYIVVYSEVKDAVGSTYKNNDKIFPLPSLYYGQKWGERWAFGMGINSPFGLSTSYDNSVPFSYATTGATVKLVNFSPNAAYKISDSVSVGAGINYYRSSVELNKVAPYSFYSAADSPVSINGDGTGVGLNTGILIHLPKRQKIGLTYKSEVAIDYEGGEAKVDIFPLTGQPYETGAKTRIRFPDMVGFGWSISPNDHWDLEVGGQWTNWTDLEKVELTFDEPNAYLPNETTRFDWKNSWTARIGTAYQMTDHWKLSGGYFYSSTPTRESTYSATVPDGNHHVVSAGGIFDSGRWIVGIPAVLVFQTGSSKIDTDKLYETDGDYNVFAYQLGLSVGLRF